MAARAINKAAGGGTSRNWRIFFQQSILNDNAAISPASINTAPGTNASPLSSFMDFDRHSLSTVAKEQQLFAADIIDTASQDTIAHKQDIGEDEVRLLFDLWNDALATEDPKIVAHRYAKKSTLFPTMSNTPCKDYESRLEYFTNFLKLKPQFVILDSNAIAGENWAQDAGIYELSTVENGYENKIQARYTFLYVFEHGEWKISSHQSSKIAAEPNNPTPPNVKLDTTTAADSIAITLKSTNEKPVLDLPSNCNHHAFISHVWSSGQDKTHSLVEKLRKYLPGIKIWLDVEHLTNLENLESSVEESAVFIIVWTDGYFRSKNCRREVYAAVRSEKPIIVLYEGDDESIEKMKERCITNCTDEGISGADVYDRISAEGHMLWLGASSQYFATASVKELSLRILKKLPYYQRYYESLSRGLYVRNELGDIDLRKKCTLLFSTINAHAQDIASEVMGASVNTDDIMIQDIECYYNQLPSSVNDHRQPFFLLYLNNKVFTDDGSVLENQVKSAIDHDLKIILVHETDRKRGGVPFDTFFRQTPKKLLNEPYNLFRDIAVTLYSHNEYRGISHRLVLCTMRDTKTT